MLILGEIFIVWWIGIEGYQSYISSTPSLLLQILVGMMLIFAVPASLYQGILSIRAGNPIIRSADGRWTVLGTSVSSSKADFRLKAGILGRRMIAEVDGAELVVPLRFLHPDSREALAAFRSEFAV